jgi:hypothetical protein
VVAPPSPLARGRLPLDAQTSSLLIALERTTCQLAALRAVVAAHEVSQGGVEEAAVETLRDAAFTLLDAGDGAKAAMVAVVALEAMKRRWSLSQEGRESVRRAWRWEVILLTFVLRSALVETSPTSPFRLELFPALRALWAEPPDLDTWIEPGDLTDLHPADLPAIGLRSTGRLVPYRPYEEEFVGDLLALASPDTCSVDGVLANDFDPVEAGDERGLVVRLYEFERLAVAVARAGSPRSRAVLEALAELAGETARRPVDEPGAWVPSAEFASVLDELAGRVRRRALTPRLG